MSRTATCTPDGLATDCPAPLRSPRFSPDASRVALLAGDGVRVVPAAATGASPRRVRGARGERIWWTTAGRIVVLTARGLRSYTPAGRLTSSTSLGRRGDLCKPTVGAYDPGLDLSRDGTRVAFAAGLLDRSARTCFERLFVARLGRAPRRWFRPRAAGGVEHIAWSADGRGLAFSDQQQRLRRPHVRVLDLEGGRVTTVARGTDPAWRPRPGS